MSTQPDGLFCQAPEHLPSRALQPKPGRVRMQDPANLQRHQRHPTATYLTYILLYIYIHTPRNSFGIFFLPPETFYRYVETTKYRKDTHSKLCRNYGQLHRLETWPTNYFKTTCKPEFAARVQKRREASEGAFYQAKSPFSWKAKLKGNLESVTMYNIQDYTRLYNQIEFRSDLTCSKRFFDCLCHQDHYASWEKRILTYDLYSSNLAACGTCFILVWLYSPRFAWGGRPHRRFISVRERG